MSLSSEVEPKTPPNPVQLTEVTIGPELIDRYNHVNYKNFPVLFEIGQDDYMGRRGIGFEQMEEQTKLKFPVKKMELTHDAELQEGDKATIATSITRVGNSSITYHQEMQKGDAIVAKLDLVVVVFDPKTGKSTPIPDDIRAKLLQPLE